MNPVIYLFRNSGIRNAEKVVIRLRILTWFYIFLGSVIIERFVQCITGSYYIERVMTMARVLRSAFSDVLGV